MIRRRSLWFTLAIVGGIVVCGYAAIFLYYLAEYYLR